MKIRMNFYQWIIFFITFAIFTSFLFPFFIELNAQIDRNNLKVTLQKFISKEYESSDIAGISAALIFKESDPISFFAGYSDIQKDRLINQETTFLAASIGKTFAAATALELENRKILSMEDKVIDWLGNKSWYSGLPNSPTITVRDLIKHTSGIGFHFATPELRELYTNFFSNHPLKAPKPHQVLMAAGTMTPSFPAGEGYEYSDLNYLLLGLVIEKASQRKYFDLVDELFLDPLKLINIFPQQGPEIPRLASGYLPDSYFFSISSPTVKKGKLIYDPSFEWTGGGFATTPSDLASWTESLFSGKVLGKEQTSLMLSKPNKMANSLNLYGAGATIFKNLPVYAIGHTGGMPGYKSLAFYVPKCELAIAIQINDERQTEPLRMRVAKRILEILSQDFQIDCT